MPIAYISTTLERQLRGQHIYLIMKRQCQEAENHFEMQNSTAKCVKQMTVKESR